MAEYVYNPGSAGGSGYGIVANPPTSGQPWTFNPAPLSALGLVEFGGIRIHDGTFVLTGLGGLIDTPDIRQTLTDRSEDHGQYLSGSFYAARQITVEGFVMTEFLEQMWPALDQLRGAFALGERQTLKRLDVLQPGWAEKRFCRVRSGGALTIASPGGGSEARKPYRDFQGVLVAPDPRLYGITLLDPDPHPLVGGSGNTFPMANAGNFPAPLTWRVVGPATNPKLIDDSRGRSIEYTGVVGSGANLVIDTLNRTATLSGGNVYKNVSRFDDLSIPPGGSVLRALTEGAGGTWRAEHRDTWI